MGGFLMYENTVLTYPKKQIRNGHSNKNNGSLILSGIN